MPPMRTYVGRPVAPLLGPRKRDRIEPTPGLTAACPLSAGGKSYPVITQWVPPPWPELRCANDRTKAILSAFLAISGKTPPISTPGRLVLTAPTVDRNSTGASILGSNVSTWVGPPPNHSQTTEVLRVDLPSAFAWARARRRSGSARPPRPRAPTLRKSRREAPSQLVPVREPRKRNME